MSQTKTFQLHFKSNKSNYTSNKCFPKDGLCHFRKFLSCWDMFRCFANKFSQLFDAIITGCGIMNVCLWYRLQEFGHNLDTAAPPHDHCCTDSGFKWRHRLKMTAAMGLCAFIFVQWIEMETRHFDLLLLGHLMDKLSVSWEYRVILVHTMLMMKFNVNVKTWIVKGTLDLELRWTARKRWF